VEIPCRTISPITFVSQLSPAAEEKPASTLPTMSGRILFAEDGPENQRLIALVLRRAGAEVDVADNGLIALEMYDNSTASSCAYDLILTDMQMPSMDGYTLTRKLRERGCALPIVALTANTMAEDRAKCIAAGCDEFASKPIDKPRLLELCAQLMNSARQLASC
jgi:CheY-like chemotaxis protein